MKRNSISLYISGIAKNKSAAIEIAALY